MRGLFIAPPISAAFQIGGYAMNSYIALALLWAWVIGFLGTLIRLHKKKYPLNGPVKPH
jgi:hypothetical protein